MSSPKRKVTLYFNSGMLAETQKEAIRQDRSVSWIIQAAWKIARDEVRRCLASARPPQQPAPPWPRPRWTRARPDGRPRVTGRPARE